MAAPGAPTDSPGPRPEPPGTNPTDGYADDGGSPRRRRAGGPSRQAAVCGAVGAAGTLAVVGYFLLSSVTAQDLWYSGIGLATTVIIALSTAIRRPANQLGWYALAGANACFVLGDGVYDVYDLVLHRAAPFPSVADALYLAGYPLLLFGVSRVSRLRHVPGAREAFADAAMVAIGALALCWHLLMRSYAHTSELTFVGKAVTLAYPIMDVSVLFILVTAMMTRVARRPVDTLIAITVAVMLVSDFTYDLLVLHSAYAGGNLVDAGFLGTYVLMAVAATHPSAALPAPVPRTEPVHRWWLPVVAAAGFTPPSIILLSSLTDVPVDAGVLSAISVALLVLAVVRVKWLFARLRSQTVELEIREKALQDALTAQQVLERDLRHQAFHDDLTGLSNRALLHDRVEHALAAAARRPGTVAVCFCDLDGFKSVNDSLGHNAGDELLVLTGRRLLSVLRPGDTVARLGGDEFAVLLDNVEDLGAVTALAERIVSVLREPAQVRGTDVLVSVSVGVALAGPGVTAEHLLAQADVAMYEAKARGKNGYAVFQPEMRNRALDRVTLVGSFPEALATGQFHLDYQPQLSLSDGRLEGFEALLRWQHPALGLVAPDRFIALAEETGFIIPLGRWVLDQACAQAAGWQPPGGEAPAISVNVSGRQLEHPKFAQDVGTALAFSGLDPRRLILEVTESVLMVDPAAVAQVLREIRSSGVRIAIDDFGTGYSSLSYLRRFPADILKIDRSFVEPLEHPDSEATAFIETILRLAGDMNMFTVAEGIEHERQLQALARMRCHSAQGYLMSRPLSAAAARAFIARSTASSDSAPSKA